MKGIRRMDYQIEEAIIYLEEELRAISGSKGGGDKIKQQHYEIALAALSLALRVKSVIVDEGRGPEDNSAEACLRKLYGGTN